MIRSLARNRWGGRASTAMAALNARHPWSHNDHFHPWILTRLPTGARRAIDVGCGRGSLLAVLADHVDEVVGTDVDPQMREAAARRCAGLPGVEVSSTPLADLEGPVDVVTMVAVLHHLDLREALVDVRRLLAPGGRFLCVGLAVPEGPHDQAWDVVSMLTNPVIGFVKHPWPATSGPRLPDVPVRDPELSLREVVAVAEEVMPGVVVRRRLGFRHTLEWTRP